MNDEVKQAKEIETAEAAQANAQPGVPATEGNTPAVPPAAAPQGQAASDNGDLNPEFEALVQALEAGEDINDQLEATAAGEGGGAAGDSVGSGARFDRIDSQANPNAGIDPDFTPPPLIDPTANTEILVEEVVVNGFPSAGESSVQLDDGALEGGNPGGVGDVNPDTANTPGILVHDFGPDGAGTISWLTSGAPAGFTYELSGDDLLIKQDGETVITVTLNPATGEYTVTQNAPVDHPEGLDENDVSFNLTYRVTDGDGDIADGSLTINVDDDTPEFLVEDYNQEQDSDFLVVEEPTLTVDETDLGTNDSANFAAAFGSVSFGADGPADTDPLVYALDVSADDVDSGIVDTLSGEKVLLSMNGDVVEGRTETGDDLVFTVSVDELGVVTLDQIRAVVHDNPEGHDESSEPTTLVADDLITLTATATDGDGDAVSETIDIGSNLAFEDDGPTANDDGPESVTEDVGTGVVSGDVLSNDDANADQPESFVSWGNDQANLDAIAALNSFGTLVQNGDGTWSYTLDNSLATTQALTAADSTNYELTYTMADADGDQASATLTITINGADDNATVETAQAEGPDATVYEAGLNPDGSDAGSDSETVSGTFTVSATDGILSVVIGGTSFTLAQVQAFNGTQTVSTGEGTLTLDSYTGDSSGGTIAYTYELDATIDNDSKVASGDDAVTLAHFDDSVEITVNGVGGTTASDDLVIRAIDDTPTATDDGPESVTEDVGTGVVSGDVLSNDDANADQPESFVSWGSDQANLDAIAALNSFGTLVQNGDGTWSYTLDNSLATTQALTAADSTNYELTYTMADADGDQASATLTITINGADDNATVETAQAEGPDATVYEAGLNPDGSDAGSDSETVSGTFTVSATDGILSVVIGGTSFTLAQVQAFNGTQTVSTGEGTLTLDSYTGDSSGGTIAYTYELDATIDNDSKVASGDDAVTLAHFDDSVEITVNGVGGTTASDDLVIRAIDDMPTAYTPTAGLLENDGVATITESLNSVGVIGADNYGGDTNVIFAAAQEGVTSLTSNDAAIYYYVSDDGKTLTASTSSTELGADGTNTVFTVTIDDTTDEYTLTMFDTVDNGSGVGFADLSGTGEAGNPGFKIVESSDLDSNLEILFTPLGATSVNSDSDDVAVGSQFIVNGDGLRVDFGDFSNDDKGTGTGQDDTYQVIDKTTINGFRFSIDQISGGSTASILLSVTDDTDLPSDHDVTNDEPDAITDVKVYDASGVLIATWLTGDDNGITFSGAAGDVTVSGLETGYSVVVYSLDGYDGIEITNADQGETDGKFSLSNLEVESSNSGDPVDLSFDTVLTDADGDISTGTIDATLAPDAVTLLGTSGDDSLVSTANNDVMFGGAGADTFVWQAGNTGVDTVADFNAGEGDVLDLSALLTGETNTSGSLDSYLNFSLVDGDTVIEVDANGDLSGTDQTIVLEGVDLVTGAANDAAIIDSLLASNSLVTDV